MDGPNEIEYLTYGPENADIKTDTIDMTNIVKREGFLNFLLDISSNYDFTKTPLSGCVWYPKNLFDCPVLFIIHGAHSAKDPSYLGYNYLGKYLSSNGYVVVSVDENIINDLETTNDARAILLLENMKEIFKINNNSENPLHKKIDKNKIALAGHSRGGESVATAYLFNDMNFYPDNGNIRFDYHFNISSLVAIAPTVDQYLPADQNIKISNVNYLLIHGSNDQDVSSVMGEKQFKNISFTDDKNFIKSSVYIMGANHG